MSGARRGRPRPIVFGVGVSAWPTSVGLAVLVVHDRLLAATYLQLRWVFTANSTASSPGTERVLGVLDATAWSRSTTVVLGVAFLAVQAGGAQIRDTRPSVVGAAAYTGVSALVQGAVAAVALACSALVGLVIAAEGRGWSLGDLPGTPSAWRWGGLVALCVAPGAMWVAAYSAARLVAAVVAAPALIEERAA